MGKQRERNKNVCCLSRGRAQVEQKGRKGANRECQGDDKMDGWMEEHSLVEFLEDFTI